MKGRSSAETKSWIGSSPCSSIPALITSVAILPKRIPRPSRFLSCSVVASISSTIQATRQKRVGRVIVSGRSEEHTSELQSLMRLSYAVFCLKKKKKKNINTQIKNNDKSQRKYKNHHTSK